MKRTPSKRRYQWHRPQPHPPDSPAYRRCVALRNELDAVFDGSTDPELRKWLAAKINELDRQLGVIA